MSITRVAAVTGANKGIGFAIVRNLCLAYPPSLLSQPPSTPPATTTTEPTTTTTTTNPPKLPLILYLTSRSHDRGTAALTSLTNDPQLRSAGVLAQDGGPITLRLKQLDVVEEGSIEEFAAWMGQEHEEGMDVLVNNAGVALEGIDAAKTRLTLRTNYHAPLQLTHALLPLLRRRDQTTSRITTLGSLVGKLSPKKFSAPLISRFLSATHTSHLTDLMHEYQTSVEQGSWMADGWPASAYVVSKAGIIGAMGVLGREALRREGGGGKVLVNTCCPGYVVTDMTKGRGRKTPDQGSRTPVKLAMGDIGGVGGEFWEHEEVSKWG